MGSLLSKEVLVPIRGAFALVEDEYTRVSSIKKLLGRTHLLTHTLTQSFRKSQKSFVDRTFLDGFQDAKFFLRSTSSTF